MSGNLVPSIIKQFFMKAKETKKVKIFLFAPQSATLRGLLSAYNNVRNAKYITPRDCKDYIRVRVRKRSNSVSDIAKQFANNSGPIIEYKLGEGQGNKIVATIRVEGGGKFQEVVETAKRVCEQVWQRTREEHLRNNACPELFLTCRVSDIIARDEKPWTEVFAVQKHAVSVDVWKQAVSELAAELGSEVFFHDAAVKEF